MEEPVFLGEATEKSAEWIRSRILELEMGTVLHIRGDGWRAYFMLNQISVHRQVITVLVDLQPFSSDPNANEIQLHALDPLHLNN